MKPASLEVQHRRTCRHCHDPIEWATTEATGRSLQISLDEVTGELALTGERRLTARGDVVVVRFVREGTGTHRRHECGWSPEPTEYEAWELEVVADPNNPEDVTAADVVTGAGDVISPAEIQRWADDHGWTIEDDG